MKKKEQEISSRFGAKKKNNKQVNRFTQLLQKKISRHTRKKNRQFCFRSTRSTTPGTPALANNRRFPPFKTKERNQHASSVGIECLTIEFDQEQIFGTDETFF